MLPRLIFLFGLSFVVMSNSWINNENVPSDTLLTINNIKIHSDTIAQTIAFVSGMNIDADGSPRAYHPVSDSGTDKLANAGKKGNWWGIVTDEKGDPILQTRYDPAPGFYVSCTSLQDVTKKISDPSRYVNSDSIPYIVLPNNKILLSKIKMGDIAYVRNLRNGRAAFAICADIGSKDKIGEGSIALADSLGINSSPRSGGIRDSVLYIVFPRSGNGQPQNISSINFIGLLRYHEGMVDCYSSGN